MRMLFLCQGWNSGTNQALLDAWRRGDPQLEICVCDAASLTLGRLSRKMHLMLARLGLPGHGGRTMGRMFRSQWYLDRMASALAAPGPAASCEAALVFGTTIPATVLPTPYYIYTDHTIQANLYYPDGVEAVGRWEEVLPYERRTIENARMVFTMSRQVSRSLVEQYGLPPERVLHVGAGCNIPAAPPRDPARYARGKILFVGVDWERKGGPELLEAFGRLRSHHPSATLTIVGCRPKVSGRGVRVVGPLSQKRTSRYLAGASIFCMPSRREPLGIAFLEAMRAGLPVVGLDLGATSDFIIEGRNGYRLPPDDVDALVDRLDRLLSDPPLCRRMGEQGRKFVRENYTWELVWRRMAVAMGRAEPGMPVKLAAGN